MYCTDLNGEIIKRIYIFPKIDLVNRDIKASINIRVDSVDWKDQYMIKDEEVIKKVNEIWNEILKEYRK